MQPLEGKGNEMKIDRCTLDKGISELVKHRGNWYVKPSLLLCAMCTNHLDASLNAAQDKPKKRPFPNPKREFKCTCGRGGEMILTLKCTKPGEQICWDW